MKEPTAKDVVESLYTKYQQNPELSNAIYKWLSKIDFRNSGVHSRFASHTIADELDTNDNKTLIFKSDNLALVFTLSDGSAFFE